MLYGSRTTLAAAALSLAKSAFTSALPSGARTCPRADHERRPTSEETHGRWGLLVDVRAVSGAPPKWWSASARGRVTRVRRGVASIFCGGGGIRTHGSLAASAVFKT